MAAIITGTPVNWSRVLFDTLVWMINIQSVGLIPQISTLMVELGVPTCPGEGLNQAQVLTREMTDSFYSRFEREWRRRNFNPPREQAEDEEWALEETDTEWTEDRTVHEDDNSARSPNDAEQNANPETTEGEEGVDTGADEGYNQEEADEAEAERLAQNIFRGINKRDEDVIDLRIRKITEEYTEGGSVSTVAPRVLAKLEKGKLEIRQEIERLEAICNQKQVPVYTAPVIEEFPIDWTTPSREEAETPRDIEAPVQEDVEVPTSKIVEVQMLEDVEVPILENAVPNLEEAVTLEPPNENAALIDSGERGDQDPTEQSTPTPPPEVTVSVPPKEWIDNRLQEFEASVSGRIDDQLKKFEMSISGQLEDRLQKFKASISEQIDDRENADAAALEADAQIAKRVQDELNAEASKDKEAPRSSQLTEAELEAERIRRAEILYPGYAAKVASQAAEDAARLEREAQRLDGFAKEHEKKKKVAASASTPDASASAPKKRKRPAPKKVQIVEMLNKISEPATTGTSQQADLVEDEVEEQLRSRHKRQRPSQQTRQPQPPPQLKKKKSAYEFTDSE
ncbi:neurofilament heavy polypeptide-like [Impatiens glandulifera]|uniref:neurofilament heavy polypeptide-like n=1 Tax=Impatiens glandulifera TaxID=253017 RepID=UPI001FB10651|nr:neurofilament heavy polypeptide-like [Impatiens glandulifera]